MEKVWIYQCNQPLNEGLQEWIQERMGTFFEQWKAHGKPLSASVEIRYDYFIVIRLDESSARATGCSIDRCVRELKDIQDILGLNFFDRLQIAYRDPQGIKLVPKETFSRLIESGEVDQNTIVFNNMVDNARDYAERWEVPVKDSWHARVFHL